MKLELQGVQNIVIFDDASYSGEQLMNRIVKPLFNYYISKGRQVHFFVIVPYVTSKVIELFESFRQSNNVDVRVFYVHKMKILLEILSREEANFLQKTEREEFKYLGATLTYFDHRVADSHSFFLEVARLMKQIPKPYGKGESTYSVKEKAEWELYWKKYLDYLAAQRKED